MVSQVKWHICSKLQDGEVKGILRQKGEMQRKTPLFIIVTLPQRGLCASHLLSSCSQHSDVPHVVRVSEMETGGAYRMQILGHGFFCFVCCCNPGTHKSSRHVVGPMC